LAVQSRRNPLPSGSPPWWSGPLLFLTVFVAYARTLNPSLFRNDSPETITACITLGVSHPPGYPLHSLLGHIFAMTAPLGNPAITLNFFSAILGALGVCLLAANLWLLLGNSGQTYRLVAAFAGALAFAFSKSYWSASLAAKGGIYSLQVDLELIFFYFLQFYFLGAAGNQKAKRTWRPMAWLTFIFALGLVNHWPTQFLTLPALGTLAFVKTNPVARNPFKPVTKHLIQTFAFVILVLSLYLYLPLRANQFPALDFGAPLSLHRFLACLLRMDYSKVETMASASPEEFTALGAKALYLSDHFLNEFNSLFLFLAALGVWGLLKKRRERVILFLLTLLLTTLIINVFYLRVIPIEFWHLDDHTLSLNWVLGIFGGCGAEETLEWLGKMHFFKGRLMARWTLGSVVVIVLPILVFFKHRDVNNQSREFLYWGYGMTALKSMDQNARYFAESDYDYFSILYLQEVEHKRPDISLKLTFSLAKKGWTDLINSFSSRRSPWGPIYCAFPNGDFITGYLKNAKTTSFKPTGTITEFMPSKDSNNKGQVLQPLKELWEEYLEPERRSSNPINGLLLELCAHPYLNTANYLKLKGDLSNWNDLYDKGLSLIQENPWLAQTWEMRADGDVSLGNNRETAAAYVMSALQYQSVGMEKEARLCLKKALAQDPSNAKLQKALTSLEAP